MESCFILQGQQGLTLSPGPHLTDTIDMDESKEVYALREELRDTLLKLSHEKSRRIAFETLYNDAVAIKAENERLRIAGDNLDRLVTSKIVSYEIGNVSYEWHSAKGIKP